MTLTAAMIKQVSEHEVSDNGPFTTGIYTTLSAVAKARLDAEDPGLPAALYDYCHALLTCHLYEIKKGGTGFKSESIGDYSYTRSEGQTTYLLEYQQTIAAYVASGAGVELPSEMGERDDADIGDLGLDQSTVADLTSSNELESDY